MVLADELGHVMMVVLSIACLIKRRSVAGSGHGWLRLLMCERAIKTMKLEKNVFLPKILIHTACPRLCGGERK